MDGGGRKRKRNVKEIERGSKVSSTGGWVECVSLRLEDVVDSFYSGGRGREGERTRQDNVYSAHQIDARQGKEKRCDQEWEGVVLVFCRDRPQSWDTNYQDLYSIPLPRPVLSTPTVHILRLHMYVFRISTTIRELKSHCFLDRCTHAHTFGKCFVCRSRRII